MTEPDIDWLACSIVEVVPGKVGGVPIIKNTRLPVTAITENYDGGVEPNEIAEMFRVSLDVVHEVLHFRQEQLGAPPEDDSVEDQGADATRSVERHALTEDAGSEEAALNAAHLASLYNRELLAAGGRCGCFYCLKTFDALEVAKWVGKNEATALCPYCHIDAVLSSISCSIDLPFLKCMNDHYFKRTVPLKGVPADVAAVTEFFRRRDA